MSTTHNDLVARAKEITAREKAVYSDRTRRSQTATERARKVMPAGVPSSFQAYEPWPVVVKHAAGSRMTDVDDNVYVDYDMGFGALVSASDPLRLPNTTILQTNGYFARSFPSRGARNELRGFFASPRPVRRCAI